MAFSKRTFEGYLLIDNRNASVDPVAARATGKNFLGSNGVTELPTLTCVHCQRQIIVQPLRTRARPYCRSCDRYMCDGCAVIATVAGGKCEPMNAKLDRIQNFLLRA